MSETGVVALPPFFNRAKQPPQQQWRIPSVLGARTRRRSIEIAREIFASNTFESS
jgi:hypothetical protein